VRATAEDADFAQERSAELAPAASAHRRTNQIAAKNHGRVTPPMINSFGNGTASAVPQLFSVTAMLFEAIPFTIT
jgi:hypothetical protein